MLVNKFKLKYGKNSSTIASYIDNEVTRFLKNDRLTEDNLKKLDEKIMKESDLRDKAGSILEDRKSERGGGRALSQRPGSTVSRKGDNQFDAKSVASSRMSGASKLSKGLGRAQDDSRL